MIQMDATLLVTIIIGLFSFFGFLGHGLAMIVSRLTELKVTIKQIQDTQAEIKTDFDKLEKKVYEK